MGAITIVPEGPEMLPEIEKSTMMLLIEARSGRDVRLVVRDAYQKRGRIEDAAEEISAIAGRTMPVSTLHTWFRRWGWSVACRRMVVAPDLPPAEPELPLEALGCAS